MRHDGRNAELLSDETRGSSLHEKKYSYGPQPTEGTATMLQVVPLFGNDGRSEKEGKGRGRRVTSYSSRPTWGEKLGAYLVAGRKARQFYGMELYTFCSSACARFDLNVYVDTFLIVSGGR